MKGIFPDRKPHENEPMFLKHFRESYFIFKQAEIDSNYSISHRLGCNIKLDFVR